MGKAGDAAAKVGVQVIIALPERESCVDLLLPAGSTVEHALAAAARDADFLATAAAVATAAGVDWRHCPVGIFGQRCGRERVLVEGDRVEVYRPLEVDPKESRRRRAAVRQMRGANPRQRR